MPQAVRSIPSPSTNSLDSVKSCRPVDTLRDQLLERFRGYSHINYDIIDYTFFGIIINNVSHISIEQVTEKWLPFQAMKIGNMAPM